MASPVGLGGIWHLNGQYSFTPSLCLHFLRLPFFDVQGSKTMELQHCKHNMADSPAGVDWTAAFQPGDRSMKIGEPFGNVSHVSSSQVSLPLLSILVQVLGSSIVQLVSGNCCPRPSKHKARTFTGSTCVVSSSIRPRILGSSSLPCGVTRRARPTRRRARSAIISGCLSTG